MLPRGGGERVLPVLMIVLTSVTGIVDAVAYLRLGHLFVANATVNVVFLGFAAAGAPRLSVERSLLAIACFMLGGFVAGRLYRRLPDDRLRELGRGTAVQCALLAAASVIAALAGRAPTTVAAYVLIALLAIAMGAQNATARKLAVPDLTTTVLTMTITGLASDPSHDDGSTAKTARRVLAIAAMLAGAIIGAVLVLQAGITAALALAATLVAGVCGGACRAAGK